MKWSFKTGTLYMCQCDWKSGLKWIYGGALYHYIFPATFIFILPQKTQNSMYILTSKIQDSRQFASKTCSWCNFLQLGLSETVWVVAEDHKVVRHPPSLFPHGGTVPLATPPYPTSPSPVSTPWTYYRAILFQHWMIWSSIFKIKPMRIYSMIVWMVLE